MDTINVAIVGASGETGGSIVNGLLASTTHKFNITALTRPDSVDKPVNNALKSRGVHIAPANLHGPQADLVKLLTGIEIVIVSIPPYFQGDQDLVADAAKAAGVKRFVPSIWATPAARGIMHLRDRKEQGLDHIKRLGLPYTGIDVGWWYQLSLRKLPSGRTDYVLPFNDSMTGEIAGDGTVPRALINLDDIGMWVEKIITDPRTLNKMVLVYNEILTTNEIQDVTEKISGEKLSRKYISKEELEAGIVSVKEKLNGDPSNVQELFPLSRLQYMYSWGIRGDDTPEYARYLGYLIGHELYQDIKGSTFEEYVKGVLDGNAKKLYESAAWLQDLAKNVQKERSS